MDEFAVIAEIQQVRSEFQLRHFVIGQHDTPEMRFYQCCIELQDMTYKLALATLTRRKVLAEIDKLTATGDPVDAVDAEIKALELQQQELAVIGAEREVECLRRILAEMPVFTRRQIEDAQPDYWHVRLARQAELQAGQTATGIGWAQLDTMLQAIG
jgi:hypothetical protein